MNERLKFQGRLAEMEVEAKRLKLRMEGLVRSIRDALDPFEDPADLACDQAAQQTVELAGIQADYKAALDEIAAINKALGR